MQQRKANVTQGVRYRVILEIVLFKPISRVTQQ